MNALQDPIDCDRTPHQAGPPPLRRENPMTQERWRGRRTLYRSRRGWVFGVCRGLADYAELPVFWVRAILVALTILSWVLPFAILYVVAAFLMKPEPTVQAKDQHDWHEYNEQACTQSMELANLRRDLEELELRALRMERQIGAKEYEWEQKLRQG